MYINNHAFVDASRHTLFKEHILMSPRHCCILILMLTALSVYPVNLSREVNSKQINVDWSGFGGISGVEGFVQAIATDHSGNVYVGGYFTIAGDKVANNIAMWDGTTWNTLGSGTNGNCSQLIIDTAGHLIAAGDFDSVGGIAANNIARWDGSKWNALGSGASSRIYAMVTDSLGSIYIGGEFQHAGGEFVSGIARWDGVKWYSLAGGINHASFNPKYCYALGIGSSGELYAGGTFDSIGGIAARNIAKWDGTSWSALGKGLGPSRQRAWGTCVAIATDTAGNLYAGGVFEGAGEVNARGIAQWNGTSWSALSEGIAGEYTSIEVLATDNAGNLYVGGYFSDIGTPTPGFKAKNIATWNGSSWNTLGDGIISENCISAITIADDGALYVGGDFTTAGNAPARGIARWSNNRWSALSSGINNSIYAVTSDKYGKIYAAGTFTSAYGVPANHIAQWDGSVWKPLGKGLRTINGGGNVNALTTDDLGNLYAIGLFDTAGEVAANNIAKWNGDSWSALGTGIQRGENDYNYFDAIAADHSGKLYVGGTFDSAGGIPASRIACWDGTTWNSLGSGVNDKVFALAIDDNNNCYVAGWFDSAGNIVVNHIAKWDGASWHTVGSDTRPQYGSIQALVFDKKGNLYAGGEFDSIGGIAAANVARWDGKKWNPLGDGITHVIDFDMDIWGVFALAVDRDGNLYAGGDFDSAGSVHVNQVARWDGSSWSTLGGGIGQIYYGVSAMTFDLTNNLYICGNLLTANDKATPYLAMCHIDGTAIRSPARVLLPATVPIIRTFNDRFVVNCAVPSVAGYRIFDLGGREMVRQSTMLPAGTQEVRIASKGLAKGMYVAKATIGSATTKWKITLR